MDNLTSGNPLAHAVRVYYEGDEIIYQGMPLCYNFNTTKNWFGGSVSDAGVVSANNTTAEGSQNEGKYIRVTSPLSLSKTSLACASGVVTGSTTDFDDVEVGMFIDITGADLTNGTYEVTAVSRYADTAANSTITLDMSAAADSTGTADTVALDNIHAFAGVVKKGGWCGNTGPRVLDIYVPNGAIVPVRTDQNCLIDQTILAVTTASQELGVPLGSGSRPVAIAKETIDRGTAGLVLAKLDPNMFMYQVSQGSALSVDDADTTSTVNVNNINIEFLGSSIYNRGLYAVGELKGTSGCQCGMWKFRTYVNCTSGGLIHTLCANLHIKDSGTLKVSTGEFSAPLYLTVETEITSTNPNITGDVAAMQIGYYAVETGGAPRNAYVMSFLNGLSDWDGFIWMGPGMLGDTLSGADEATHVVGFDGDGITRKIPIEINNVTYYFLVGTAIQAVTDA